MKSLIFIVFSILFIQSLCAQSGNKSKVTILNLAESFSKQQEVSLSKFVDKITYIPLETNPEALIPEFGHFEVTEEFVIAKTGDRGKFRILLFDRKTGKFIRQIGKQGRGPGEFHIWSPLPFNPVKKELYAIGASGEILVYNLSGSYIDKIQDKMLSTITHAFYSTIDSNIFVGYVPNFSGLEKKKLVLLSKEGVLKIFPNYLTWKSESKSGTIVAPFDFVQFYRWDNKVNFIEAYCDTLYQITIDSLLPRYFFDWGKYNAPYSKQTDIKWYDYFFIMDIDENKNYIFFRCVYLKEDYTGFIDKRNNNVTFCKIGASGTSALKDDISGLMDVIPKDFTQENEMVYVIQPVKLMKWLKENPEKAENARNKLSWLKNIDEFSNPVIAIGKCKE